MMAVIILLMGYFHPLLYFVFLFLLDKLFNPMKGVLFFLSLFSMPTELFNQLFFDWVFLFAGSTHGNYIDGWHWVLNLDISLVPLIIRFVTIWWQCAILFILLKGGGFKLKLILKVTVVFIIAAIISLFLMRMMVVFIFHG